MRVFLVAMFLVLSVTGVASAAVPDYTDLWDISQGNVVTNSSPMLDHEGGSPKSDRRDMFGGNFGVVLTGTTYFEDWYYQKGLQWISWSTANPVTIGSFNLFSADYHETRSYSWFKLYANNDATPIYTFIPTGSFGGVLEAIITPVTASDFRAEFGWYQNPSWSVDTKNWNSSVRILELDGFAPAAIPEPATMSLLGLGFAGLLRFRRKVRS